MVRSNAEVEFRALALDLCELLWLKIVLEDLRISHHGSIKLCCDNKLAISITHNPMQHDRAKHVEIDRHFIKEKLENGLICIPYVLSEQQLADLLTKGLPIKRFEDLLCKLRMTDIRSSA